MNEEHYLIDEPELTPTQLEVFRRFLFFSVPEAAAAVAGVSEQAWRRWEAGTRKIPTDVSERMHEILAWRKATVLSLTGALNRLPINEVMTLPWYESAEDWAQAEKENPALWRVYQSACAELANRWNDRIDFEIYKGPDT